MNQRMGEFGPRPDGASSAPPRVLIVDDEATIRTALRRFFARIGWDVDEAGDGGRALELIAAAERDTTRAAYALVVSDLRMPGVSGIELHDHLARDRPDILARVIFCTGDVVSQEVALFLRSTARPVLQKPFDLMLLRREAELVLELVRTAS
jgi:CheY-like chemotaxis protein